MLTRRRAIVALSLLLGIPVLWFVGCATHPPLENCRADLGTGQIERSTDDGQIERYTWRGQAKFGRGHTRYPTPLWWISLFETGEPTHRYYLYLNARRELFRANSEGELTPAAPAYDNEYRLETVATAPPTADQTNVLLRAHLGFQ